MATTLEVKPEAVTLSNDEILRYSRHLIMPEVGMEGQLKLKAARVLCIGAGGLGSPLALYLGAAGVGTLGIVDFDVVDYTNLQRQIIHSTADVGRKKLDSAAEKLKAINPFLNIRKFDTRLSQRKRAGTVSRVRHHRRRHRQLSHALPGERCLRAYRQAQRLRLDFPLRRPGQRFRHQGRSLLPLPVSRAATAGTGSFLRRRRRAGHSARAGRRDSGDGSHQADSGQRRAADRPAAADRCAGHEVPRTQAAQESRLPGLRNESYDHEVDRLQRILRNSRRGEASGNFNHRHSSGRTEDGGWMQARICSCWTCASRTNIRSATSAGI